jgi:hypothetical protein
MSLLLNSVFKYAHDDGPGEGGGACVVGIMRSGVVILAVVGDFSLL